MRSRTTCPRGAKPAIGTELHDGHDFCLLSLSYLHRAQSYEALGEAEGPERYYRPFMHIWK